MSAVETFVNPWGWLVLAVVLAGLEIIAPGAFMIWLSGAALLTAVAAAALGLSWPWQLGAFAAFALVAVIVSKRVVQRNPIESDEPTLNRRADALVGATVTVVEPIVRGQGKVKVGDSPWVAIGPDAPAGTSVRVVAVDGATLRVTPH